MITFIGTQFVDHIWLGGSPAFRAFLQEHACWPAWAKRMGETKADSTEGYYTLLDDQIWVAYQGVTDQRVVLLQLSTDYITEQIRRSGTSLTEARARLPEIIMEEIL